jgi:hypothetical protein
VTRLETMLVDRVPLGEVPAMLGVTRVTVWRWATSEPLDSTLSQGCSNAETAVTA